MNHSTRPPPDLPSRQAHFLARCKAAHGNRFDYSEFVYLDAKTHGAIICPEHGRFRQTPDKHLAKRSKGCPQCWATIRDTTPRGRPVCSRASLPPEEFLRRARAKYGDRYSYNLSTYVNLTEGEITITCPKHGPFVTLPATHLLKSQVTGCPSCGFERRNQSKTGTYAEFVGDSRKVHGDRYTYPSSNEGTYQTRRSKVKIECPKHGPFEMKAQKHLVGQRCWKCAVDDMIENDSLVGGYSERLFDERPDLKELPAVLYYLRVNDGQFYKIGITRTATSERIKGLKCKADGAIKSCEIAAEAELPLYEAFRAEQFILQRCKAHRVGQPWTSELFDRDIMPLLSP